MPSCVGKSRLAWATVSLSQNHSNGSSVESSYCSYRGSKFWFPAPTTGRSQAPTTGRSQAPVTPAQMDLVPSSALCGTCTQVHISTQGHTYTKSFKTIKITLKKKGHLIVNRGPRTHITLALSPVPQNLGASLAESPAPPLGLLGLGWYFSVPLHFALHPTGIRSL